MVATSQTSLGRMQERTSQGCEAGRRDSLQIVLKAAYHTQVCIRTTPSPGGVQAQLQEGVLIPQNGPRWVHVAGDRDHVPAVGNPQRPTEGQPTISLLLGGGGMKPHVPTSVYNKNIHSFWQVRRQPRVCGLVCVAREGNW